MSPLKRLLRHPRAQSAFGFLIAAYIRLVWSTGRWRVVDRHRPGELLRGDRCFIGVFWHERLVMMPFSWSGVDRPFRMLISRHADGEIVARAIARFGLKSVRGSRRQGAGQALREMLRALRSGDCIGITPDGPRGPARTAHEGALALARLADAPILPVAFAARPAIRLGTWDRLVVPLPFARGVILWGAPITVVPQTDVATIERQRGELAAALDRVTAEADRLAALDAAWTRARA